MVFEQRDEETGAGFGIQEQINAWLAANPTVKDLQFHYAVGIGSAGGFLARFRSCLVTFRVPGTV
jgi:hypothetical protein